MAIFFIISGYFCIFNSEIKPKGIFKVCKELSFYGILQAILMLVASRSGLVEYGVLEAFHSAFLPVTGNVWWFATAYIFLMVMSPAINQIFCKLSEHGYRYALLIIFIFMLVLDGLFSNEYYSLERAVMFYSIGGYIRKYGDKASDRKIGLIAFFTVGAVLYMVCYFVVASNQGEGRIASLFDTCASSLATILCAVSLFLFIKCFDFNSILINKIASLVFGVYLIHDSSLGRSVIWDKIFHVQDLYLSEYFPIWSIAIITVIMICGCCFDFLRQRFLQRPIDWFLDKLILIFK